MAPNGKTAGRDKPRGLTHRRPTGMQRQRSGVALPNNQTTWGVQMQTDYSDLPQRIVGKTKQGLDIVMDKNKNLWAVGKGSQGFVRRKLNMGDSITLHQPLPLMARKKLSKNRVRMVAGQPWSKRKVSKKHSKRRRSSKRRGGRRKYSATAMKSLLPDPQPMSQFNHLFAYKHAPVFPMPHPKLAAAPWIQNTFARRRSRRRSRTLRRRRSRRSRSYSRRRTRSYCGGNLYYKRRSAKRKSKKRSMKRKSRKRSKSRKMRRRKSRKSRKSKKRKSRKRSKSRKMRRRKSRKSRKSKKRKSRKRSKSRKMRRRKSRKSRKSKKRKSRKRSKSRKMRRRKSRKSKKRSMKRKSKKAKRKSPARRVVKKSTVRIFKTPSGNVYVVKDGMVRRLPMRA